MKKFLKYIGMAVSSWGLTACSADFLERIPEGQYVEETYYMSDAALDACITVPGSITTSVRQWL